MRARGILLAIGLSAVFSAGAAEGEKLTIGDRETIVFYGDSITEQNLYSAYLETFLITRFPQKDLAIYNFGWSGDTAKGGAGRFLRDAGRVKPSLVFVNFGMNDGGYMRYEDWIGESYIAAQRRMAGIVRKSGARLVWFTQSPVDCHEKNVPGWCPGYNGTLERMAGMLKSLGAETGVQVIDLFSPMLAILESAKRETPGSTFIPDSIHPDETGHMVMAYCALKAMVVEAGGGVLSLGAGHAAADGRMAASNLRRAEGRIEFDLHLPFIPFYVPQEARRALSLVPFQEEFNRFVLRVPEWDQTEDCEVYVDGLKVAVVPGGRMVEGLDLAALDSAPWAVQAERVWEISQVRWKSISKRGGRWSWATPRH